MEKYMLLLTQSPLFAGIANTEILQMLNCLDVKEKEYPKGTYIFQAGDTTASMGIVLAGSVLLIQEDLWGRRNIFAKISPGESFLESSSAFPNICVDTSVFAEEDCTVVWLNVNRILTLCSSVCPWHSQVVKNFVSVLAQKTLICHEKITHISRKTTKEKLLSYLSAESLRQKKLEFDIPYDRQQLADFLCVERAAMSVELSKLQKEGFIECRKNHFLLRVNIGDDGRLKKSFVR